MESDLQDGLVLLDGLCDGHLDLVAKEMGLLVASLDLSQHLLSIGSLKRWKGDD